MYEVLTNFLSSLIEDIDFDDFLYNMEDFSEIKIGNIYIRKGSLILNFSLYSLSNYDQSANVKIFLHRDDEGITSKDNSLEFDFTILKDLLDPNIDEIQFSLIHNHIIFSDPLCRILEELDLNSEIIKNFLKSKKS